MSLFVLILLIVLGVVGLATLIYVAFKYGLKKQPENLQFDIEYALGIQAAYEVYGNEIFKKADPKTVIKEEIVVIEEPVDKVEEVIEEPVEQVVEEQPVVVEENQEIVATELEDDSDDREIIKRVPFAEKLLGLDVKTQEYYDALVNEFISYRKINRRISTPCLSLRFGRDLVAKITARGKTMKLHLNLDVNKFEPNIFFQKDLSDVKAYQEVPFTVKVKSDRAVKNAIKLIGALAEVHGIEKKVRYEKIDALNELKESLNKE